MRVRFFCYTLTSGNGLHTGMVRGSTMIDASREAFRMYNEYLLSALSTDFPEHHPELIDGVLHDIERLERGEIETAEWGGEGFCHSLTRDKVIFEHTIFGECPEWPIWSCPLSHYKAALLGWRRFIDLPKAIDTELIVELPESA